MNVAYRFGQVVGAVLIGALIAAVVTAFLGIPLYLAIGYFVWDVAFETAVVGLLGYTLLYTVLL